METIILVSVLATLGVGSILFSIVVAFIKLKSKVDVNEFQKSINNMNEMVKELRFDLDSISNSITLQIDRNDEHLRNELHSNIRDVYRNIEDVNSALKNELENSRRDIYQNTEDVNSALINEIDSVRRIVDSRVDKVESKITRMSKNEMHSSIH